MGVLVQSLTPPCTTHHLSCSRRRGRHASVLFVTRTAWNFYMYNKLRTADNICPGYLQLLLCFFYPPPPQRNPNVSSPRSAPVELADHTHRRRQLDRVPPGLRPIRHRAGIVSAPKSFRNAYYNIIIMMYVQIDGPNVFFTRTSSWRRVNGVAPYSTATITDAEFANKYNIY